MSRVKGLLFVSLALSLGLTACSGLASPTASPASSSALTSSNATTTDSPPATAITTTAKAPTPYETTLCTALSTKIPAIRDGRVGLADFAMNGGGIQDLLSTVRIAKLGQIASDAAERPGSLGAAASRLLASAARATKNSISNDEAAAVGWSVVDLRVRCAVAQVVPLTKETETDAITDLSWVTRQDVHGQEAVTVQGCSILGQAGTRRIGEIVTQLKAKTAADAGSALALLELSSLQKCPDNLAAADALSRGYFAD